MTGLIAAGVEWIFAMVVVLGMRMFRFEKVEVLA